MTDVVSLRRVQADNGVRDAQTKTRAECFHCSWWVEPGGASNPLALLILFHICAELPSGARPNDSAWWSPGHSFVEPGTIYAERKSESEAVWAHVQMSAHVASAKSARPESIIARTVREYRELGERTAQGFEDIRRRAVSLSEDSHESGAKPWTPTTEEVRANYVANRVIHVATTVSPANEFDRWLADHDAQLIRRFEQS